MKRILIDQVEIRQDEETEELYFGKCVECGKLLNAEEMGYGHDCE
jgi:hypothetical protein